jgi:DNA-binding IclR family transcriptional regulator
LLCLRQLIIHSCVGKMPKTKSTAAPVAAKPASKAVVVKAPKTRATAPHKDATEQSKRRGIQSIEIGFRILDVLRTAGRPLPLRQIAEDAGMAVANVHYYLVSFQAVGVIRQEADSGHYGLGPYALKLGMAALEQFDVFTAARPVMAELAATVGHTVFLGVWGNRGPTIVYRIEGGASRPILELRVGSVLPLLNSALGRNFLAHLPRTTTGELLKQELKINLDDKAAPSHSDLPQSTADIEKMLASVKENGLSRCRDALLPHFTSLSAPVFDHLGEMIAAITLMGPMGILDDDFQGITAKTLKARALQISRDAGFGKETDNK